MSFLPNFRQTSTQIQRSSSQHSPHCQGALFIATLATSLSLTTLIAQPADAADVTFNFKMDTSGTPNFDADDTAGNDSSETNNIVRTQDVITYKWEYAINNGAATNVVLNATVPANVEIIMPAACNPATSQITTNTTTGEQTIRCAIGTLASGSAGNVDLKARVLGKERAPTSKFVANGDKTLATGSFTGSQITNTLNPITTAPLTISAKPKADLLKDAAYVEGAAVGEDGVTQGLVIRYPITIATTGGGKGGEALVGPINFTDQLIFNGGANDGQMIPGAKLYTWRPGYSSVTPGTNSSCNRAAGDPWAYYGGYPNGKIGSNANPGYDNPAWTTTDSGNWTCTQSGPGQPIQINITGADTTGNHIPTRDYYGGTVLAADKTYLVVGMVHLWVPVAVVTAAGGQLNVRNQVSGFTVNSASGALNVEPTLANNQYDHTLVSTNGAFTSYYATDVDNRGTPLPGMSAIYGGDGAVMPGQTFTDRAYIYNSGVLPWAVGSILCTAVDNQNQRVTPLADDPNTAVRNFSSAGLGTDYVIEYGTGDFPTVLDHKKATCRDSDSPGGWTTNVNTVPGGLDAITRIRVRSLNPFPAGNVWDIAVNLTARNYYPGTTTKVPLNTKLVEHSSFYIPDFPGAGQGEPGMPAGWYAGYYQRDNHYYIGWGDRLFLTRVLTRIKKENVPNQPVVNAIAGSEVSFVLKPTLTAPVPASLPSDVLVKDFLPADLDYVVGSANLPPTSVVNNPDGTQVVIWDFGPRMPGQPLPEISYKAMVRPDAANNSTATNVATIYSPDEGSPEPVRSGTVNVTVGNTAAFRIFKEVDRVLIDKNEPVNYSLFYANTGSSNVGPSQFIDVLPYNGDNRVPQSNYQGTATFNTITGTNGETYEYTNRPPVQIVVDPNDASNQPGGATQWCTGFGAAGCPAAAAAVTGIRISAPAFPKNTPTRKLTLNMTTNGNVQNNFYTNNFTGRATGLLGLLQSNDVFSKVRVPANLVLVKRITAINNVPIAAAVDDPNTLDDNAAAWPAGYLKGVIDGGVVKPGDDLEYTIYYLSNGDAPVTNAMLCDLVPMNVSYLPTGFNTGTGADRGIQLDRSISSNTLTGIADSDIGTFFLAGSQPNATCSAANQNGAVTIQLGNVTQSGYGGNPTQAYGLMRFRAKVK
jgi:uncharacterized repeat protein (TIGR01451 family)